MANGKDKPTKKAKPHGNPDPAMPDSPDVKEEGWSAEQVAEQSAYKDGTEVKEEMKEGKKTKRKSGA
jgi:hypothetical protein